MYLMFVHQTCNSFMSYLGGKVLQLMVESEMPIDLIEFDYAEGNSQVEDVNEIEMIRHCEPSTVWTEWRDKLAQDMFASWKEQHELRLRAVDIMEDLDVQDNTFINEFVEQEGVKDSESREDTGASTCQSSDVVVPAPAMKKKQLARKCFEVMMVYLIL
ncbi:hypothetical protein V6N11_060612 [Hibiscus sabdariffa]|uniref:Uncharacterized protein n=1 Tax=Hibiscus sabdariffa TaxID=183260 RepID=A0ABR2QQV7_9ROSI